MRTNNLRQVEGGVNVSSIVNEGIRAILNLFIFFYKKISHAQKAQKAQKLQKVQKAQKAHKARKT